MKIFIYLIFLTLAALLFHCESKYISIPENPRAYLMLPTRKLINICSMHEKAPLIKCHCDKPKPAAASRAYCSLIGNLQKDNLFWENFMSQPNLETVLISAITEPGLTHVPTDLIRNATKLKNLEIEYGLIRQLPPFAFANSHSLQQLSLANNKLFVLEPNAFSHLPSLSNLTVSDNNITEIKRAVFYDLPNLNRLKLSNNQITKLHAGCFKHLNKLTHLNLNSNSLSVISRENFEGLTNILRLNLKRNKLTYIGDLTFVDLWSLEELFLDDNQIKFIYDRGFAGLARLRTLSLAGNELTVLGDGTFHELINVNFISLNNNVLTELKAEAFKPILESLRRIEFVFKLHDNHLVCDCSLSWLKSLRNDTRSLLLQATLDALLCSSEAPLPTVPLPSHFIQENVTKGKIIAQDDYDYEEQMNQEPVVHKSVKVKADSPKYLTELLSIPDQNMPCKKKAETLKSTVNLSTFYNKGHIHAKLAGFPVALSIANMMLKV